MKYALVLKCTVLYNDSTTTTNSNFYPRVVNNTNITFSKEELTLLNKELKYNLHFK